MYFMSAGVTISCEFHVADSCWNGDFAHNETVLKRSVKSAIEGFDLRDIIHTVF